MIDVLLVDDEPRLRSAWEKLFARQPDLRLVAALARADDLLATARATPPHVAVVDLTMPGKDPLEAIRELAAELPAVRSVVYSAHSHPDLLRSALDAGAWGYVDKLASPGEMFDTLRRVAAGHVVFPPELTEA